MKPNLPNTGFAKKTFVKLPGLGIVGQSVTQFSEPSVVPSSINTADYTSIVTAVKEEVFNSSTPSMIGDQFTLPPAPDSKTYILASVNNELKWLETDSCRT